MEAIPALRLPPLRLPLPRLRTLVYLKAAPKEVDLIPGFTGDMTGIGRHGTSDLELQLRRQRHPRWGWVLR
ncbi:hypothetical protein ACFCZY_41770 [Streptomyces sp. NPDC056237]|uniref:hypothetical protein n=1 Tax=Streptomyces sp. NPDC056237 TaxID=3345758 RepID=UPI0035DACBFE